jgi:hypothetical protein
MEIHKPTPAHTVTSRCGIRMIFERSATAQPDVNTQPIKTVNLTRIAQERVEYERVRARTDKYERVRFEEQREIPKVSSRCRDGWVAG